MVKATASLPPIASQEFESLTLALNDWFDKNLDDLPLALRQRVERDFFPMAWDDLSADNRRSVALQWDYQHDPTTEQDRQSWWDFFVRMEERQEQVEQWKAAATPTASDISLKESRLKELQQEIDRMELQQRQARDDYYPERNSFDAYKEATPTTTDYIAYPRAIKILRERWKATPEELAAWISLGSETGGIAAYRNANELNPPPRFFFAPGGMSQDYLSPLMACWFRRDDIDRFEPTDRYITGAALIERWSRQPDVRPEAFIRAKIAESRLLDMHPTYGGTQGTFGDNEIFPPLSDGLFAMSDVEQIEDEDSLDLAPVLPNSDAVPVPGVAPKKGGRPKGPLAEAIGKAYHHFLDSGNVDILKPGNICFFLKSFRELVKKGVPLEEFGNRKINNYICDRIEDVIITRAGKCLITTQERQEGKITIHSVTYSNEVISKQLSVLRKNYPLPT